MNRNGQTDDHGPQTTDCSLPGPGFRRAASAPLALTLAALALGAAGCGKSGGGGAGGPPPGMVMNVRVAPAVRQPLEEKIALVATVYANESIDVQSEINGTVAQVNFEEGRPVTNGQLLVQLDTRKLQASVSEAEANFNLAKANRERAESMLANRTISQQEADQALASFESSRATLELFRQRLGDAAIYAPFEGVTGARRVSPGQVIAPATTLTTLVDVQPLKVEFRVPERFVGQLAVGQSIAFRVAAYPGEEFGGKVFFIDPQVSLETRTVAVKALQDNAAGRLRPGMFGNLDLILRVSESAIVVPERAVFADGDQEFLLKVDAENKAVMVPVKVGQRLAGSVQIIDGLAGGETVIVEGTQKVQPGMPVNPLPLEDAAAVTNAVPVEKPAA